MVTGALPVKPLACGRVVIVEWFSFCKVVGLRVGLLGFHGGGFER